MSVYEQLRLGGKVALGEGALVEDVDGVKVAVYRDEAGKLHALNPHCTHLTCIVQWNPAEKSWDCPCHGSRFSAEGKVIHGPATRDLERDDKRGAKPYLPAKPVGGSA